MIGAIGAFVSAVSGALSAASSAIGGAIGGLMTKIPTVMGPILGPVLDPIKIIEAIAKMVSFIGEAFGLTKSEEKVEELGAKAVQPGVSKSEEFESTEAYIKYLREEVAFDEARFNSLSQEEKLACKLAGTSIIVKGVEEKTGVVIPPEALVTSAKMEMKGEDFKAVVDAFKETGLESLKDFVDYLVGKIDMNKIVQVASAITKAIASQNPSMPPEIVQEKIMDWKDLARK